MTSLQYNERKLDYFESRLQWATGRIFGDTFPDHPIYGPIPGRMEMLDLTLKVSYIPRIMAQLNKPSVLAGYMDEESR